MILTNIESNINGVDCRFSDRKVLAYHLVYDNIGKIIVIEQGNIEVGTPNNLFSCTTFDELKAEVHAQGLFFDENTPIKEEIKEALLL